MSAGTEDTLARIPSLAKEGWEFFFFWSYFCGICGVLADDYKNQENLDAPKIIKIQKTT